MPSAEHAERTFTVAAIKVTFRPWGRLLCRRWKKAGYKTAYVPVSACRALVAAVDCD